MSDIEARLARLEHDRDERATSWLRRAAKESGWVDPDTAARVIPPNEVESPQDARARVQRFSASQPYFIGAATDQEEAERRRHGQELLAGLERGGRS